MREIKFRGKRLDNGKWAIGDLRHRNDSSVTIITNLNVWSDNNDKVDAYGEEFEVDPATVGQYTGLNGMNGKEIYEDDILKDRRDGSTYCVTFKQGMFFALVHKRYKNLFSKFPLGVLIRQENENYAIIGNIHDNPELMEGFKL